MASALKKITLSTSRDIPFNRLVLSQANVRRVKAGVSVAELAEDIARRGLLQGLSVRAVLNAAGDETGMFEIPAGGRRYRALELLVRQKRLAKTAPVPCIVREGGIAEEDSLAENVQRAPLHPLDQFRAFQTLREKGQSEEETAAAFFVSPTVVRQRLKLASVSPKLLEVYAEDQISLDQLMAFTVNPDHERQEQVYDRVQRSRTIEPYMIRRMLTENAVRATDKRARFVGIDAYVAAGGAVMNDLFSSDDGAWLQDVALVDRLVAEKLEREADAVRAEGWKWSEAALDLPYGHVYGLRRLRSEPAPLTVEEEAARAALQAEYDDLERLHADADELPEGADVRFAEIETALAAFEERPGVFVAEDIVHAGAFVSVDGMGQLRVERGYVRPEDEPPVEPEPAEEATPDAPVPLAAAIVAADNAVATAAVEPAESEDEMILKPLSDRLHTELTAWRTLALRNALGERPDIAALVALHALCLRAFYRYPADSCLDIELRSAALGSQGGYGFADTPLAQGFDAQHARWQAQLPAEPQDLWAALVGFDPDSRDALFAHCVSLGVNALYDPYTRRPRALAHADRLAEALDLDVAATGWTPTVESYLGRVTKARILQAVEEARGDDAVRRLENLRKGEMAEAAEGLLESSGWLPEPLRTPGRPVCASGATTEGTEPAATADEAVVADENVATASAGNRLSNRKPGDWGRAPDAGCEDAPSAIGGTGGDADGGQMDCDEHGDGGAPARRRGKAIPLAAAE
jgi:ParB family chromosome partitioning protein